MIVTFHIQLALVIPMIPNTAMITKTRITTTIVPIFRTSAVIAMPRFSDFNPNHARNIPIALIGKEHPKRVNAIGIPAIPMINAIKAIVPGSDFVFCNDSAIVGLSGWVGDDASTGSGLGSALISGFGGSAGITASK